MKQQVDAAEASMKVDLQLKEAELKKKNLEIQILEQDLLSKQMTFVWGPWVSNRNWKLNHTVKHLRLEAI